MAEQNVVANIWHNTLDINELKARRNRFMDCMQANGVAILTAAPVVQRNSDADYPYRQNSDFLYLTGFNEPEAVLVLIKEQAKSVLFCRNRDAVSERWNGYRMNPDQAPAALGVDAGFGITEIDNILPDMLKAQKYLYCSLNEYKAFDQRIFNWVGDLKASSVRDGVAWPEQFIDLSQILHDLRLHKSAAEIDLMMQAGKISAQAHRQAMIACKPGLSEANLEAELIYEFMRNGARWPAYTSIVAGGDNACVLHYTNNNQLLRDGDLVLIDAGCELAGYASDLTRTFPANGRFSEDQLVVYKIVLAAQQAAINCAREGLPYDGLQQASDRVLTEGLLDLGVLEGELEELVETKAAQPFSIHKVGHWLGLDVHDVGNYRADNESRSLAPNMVTTVEPGLYFPSDCQKSPPHLQGIGIRIEDSVAITEAEPLLLTDAVPRQPEDIEHLMKQ